MEKNKKKQFENLKKNVLLSIITPCYNVEKYLNDYFNCIDDINCKSIEFVIINDGSTDNTRNLFESYIKSHKDKNIKYINQSNMGVGKTRTNLINAASGKYIMSLDADDFLKFNCVNLICDILIKEEPDALCINFAKVKENFKYKRIPLKSIKYDTFYSKDINDILINLLSLRKIIPGSGSFIFKKNLVDKIKIKDVIYKDIIGEDTDFEIRCLLQCKKVLVSQSCHYFYRMRKTSLMHNSFNEKYITNLDFVNRVLEKDIANEVQEYALARKCLSSIDVMQKMINSKYFNIENINYVFETYCNNLKYIKKCKLLPWYIRYFTFLSKPYFYLRLRPYLK